MKREIRMPRLGVNDNYVTLGQWLVKTGEYVEEGACVAIVETAKETSEIAAHSSGFFCTVGQVRKEYEIEQIIAYICDTQDEAVNTDSVSDIQNADVRITKNAALLADKYEIDISLINTKGIITEKTIQSYIDKNILNQSTISFNRNPEYNDVIILSGGGMCKMCISVIRSVGGFNIHGIVDNELAKGSSIMGVNILGGDDMLKSFYHDGYRSAINALGSITSDNEESRFFRRKGLYENAKLIGFIFPNIIHPSAVVDSSALLGEGNLIFANAIVDTEATIGNNTIINTGSIISHDCCIGDHARISPGAILAGGVTVGENSLIGMGVTVYMNVKIGSNVIIGNGKHIFSNIPDNIIVK